MSKKFKLLSVTGPNQVNQTTDITKGAGAQGKPVIIQAKAGHKYQLVDMETQVAPHTIRAKRSGKSLHVFFEDSQQADLVIENFYDEGSGVDSGLIGQAENGTLYDYIPEDADPAGLVPNLADGDNLVGMALGNSQGFVVTAAPLLVAAAAGPGLGLIAAGLGGAALVAGAGGGSTGGTPTAPNGAQAPTVSIETDTNNDGMVSAAELGNATSFTVKAAFDATKVAVGDRVVFSDGTNTKTVTLTQEGITNGFATTTFAKPTEGATLTVTATVRNPANIDSPQGQDSAKLDTVIQVLITDPGKGNTTNSIGGTGEPGALITVQDDTGNVMGTANVGSDGKWTLTPAKAMPIGALKATATDLAGNSAMAASDNTGAAPAAPIITSVVDNLAGLTGNIQKYTTGNTGSLDKGITNDTTPTLNGTAVPGAVVTIYDAGAPIGSTTVGSDGRWSFTPTTALAAGERVFTAGATLAGVSGPKTGDYPVLIDTSAPTTPVVDPTGTSTNTGTGTGNTYSVIDSVGVKTGVVADGSTIDDASPIINGKGEAGATVSIFDKGDLLGTAVVGADGKWSFKPSTPFANGSTHTITTQMTDTAGNTSPLSAATAFTIDTSNTPVALSSVTDDVASKTGPLAAGDQTNDNKPTLAGTGTPGTTVTIKDGTTTLGTAVVDTNGNWNFTPTTALTDGPHSLTVSGADKAGNLSTTSPFALTVDTSVPAAPKINAYGDDVGSVQNAATASGTTTDDTTPTLKGTAEANSTVQIKDGAGNVVGNVKADGTGNWSYTLAQLPKDGVYSYTATATDAAGNVSPVSVPLSLTLDTTAPAAPSGALEQFASSDSGTLGDNLTSVKTPTITGKAEAGAKVEVTVNGKTYTTTADATGKYTVPVTDTLPDGPYTPSIKVTDPAGNSTTNPGTRFTVDATAPNGNAAPRVTITTDANNDGFVNSAELNDANNWTVAAAFDKTKVSVGDTVRVSDGFSVKNVVLQQADIDNGFASTTFTKPDEGATLTVTASVIDASGNESPEGTDSAKMDTTASNDNNAPTVTITTDANDDGFVNSNELNGASTVAVQAAFDKTNVAVGDTVRVSDGSTTTDVVLTQADIDKGFITTTFNKPAEGSTLSVTATVVDAAGNQTPQGTDSAKIDTTASNSNAAPTVTITTDTNNDGLVNIAELKGSPTFAVKAEFNKTKVFINDRIVFNDGTTTQSVVLTQIDIDNGYATTTFDNPIEGDTLTITARVSDAAGNQTAPGSDSGKLDTTSPRNVSVGLAIGISTDTNNDTFVNTAELGAQTTFTSRITVNSTAVVGDKVVITASNGSTALTAITRALTASDISNGFDVTFTKPSEGEIQTVTANYVDAAGNAATDAQATDNAKLDTITPNSSAAPTVTITTDANNDGFVNSAELNGATTVAVQAAFDKTNVAVGDTVRVSDGSTTTNLVLTQADIDKGFVTTTFTKPAEGSTLSVTATVIDAAGNQTPQGTDSAKIDTTAPTNATVGMSIAISTDANNDGFVNAAELGSSTTFTSRVSFISAQVQAGDQIVFGVRNVLTNLPAVNYTLTQADVDKGYVDLTSAKPNEGALQTVTANFVDKAGNAATDTKPSDAARLDTGEPLRSITIAITSVTDNEGSETGVVSDGGRTDDTSPLVSGTLSRVRSNSGSGEQVWLYRDGEKIATLTPIGLSWSYQDSGLTLGQKVVYTAQVVDLAGNPPANSNAYTVNLGDTTASNGNAAPTVSITTDANNDGFVNSTELDGATTVAVQAAFDKTKVAVGDTVRVSDGSTTTDLVLTQADIDKGFVTTTFTKPAEGATLNVTATVIDAAGNQTPQGTDSAKIDTTAPTNAAVGLTVGISTDTNNDTFVNTAELGAQTTFTSRITVNSTAVVGDKVVITASNGSTALTAITRALTASDISNGFDVTFTKPSEGEIQTVTANYVDAAGNAATDAQATDNAKLDTTASNGNAAPTVTITTDANDDGLVNSAELDGATTVAVQAAFDKTNVAVGDTVRVSDGSTTTNLVLTQADIDKGFVTTTFTKPAEGATLTVTATVIDAAGNQTPQGTDSAKMDTTAPTNAAVGLTVGISTDTNNDTFVNTTELGAQTTFTSRISVNSTAVVGDKVVITASNGSTALTAITRTLTASDISNGFDVTFAKPADGEIQTVTANYVDAAGNAATDAQATDNAKLDTTAPTNAAVGLTVGISTDANNDAFVNAAELNNGTTFTSRITVNSTAVVGDQVVITATNGTTALIPITRTLTASDISNGFDVTFSRPNEGRVQTVTANYVDAAGNPATDTKPSDSATLDTIFPNNRGTAPTVTITTDVNNDGFINTTELNGSSNLAVEVSFDETRVAVGDKVMVTDGVTVNTFVLTQSDIDNGYVLTSFAKPAEGGSLTVSAKMSDVAGNETATGTDTAQLDTTTPNGNAAPTVTITTDTNNDGYVNIAELNASTTFAIQAAFDKTKVAVDNQVIFSNGTNQNTVTLTQTDIDNGFATTSFNKPEEGTALTVTARIIDPAGNQTPQGQDSAILDTIKPNNVGVAPTVTITTDTNNDGVVSASELGTSTTFAVRTVFDPARVSVGDTLTLNNGTTTNPVVLTQTDINNGFVITSYSQPAEGDTLTVTAKITDVAGNETATGSDSAKLAAIVSSNTAPTLAASAVGGVYTAGATAGVDLYGSVSAQVGNGTANTTEVSGGQRFQKLVVTASGLLDGSNETLTLAGTAVALTNGTTATVTGGWQANVTGSGSTATITLTNSSGVDANTLQTFIDGWTYRNSKASLTVGERTFVITNVQDTGGVADNGIDSTALNITTTVASGNPPTVGPTEVPVISLNNIANGQGGFRIDGTLVSDTAGNYVSTVGDFNGDGLDDIAIGAYFSSDTGSNLGRTYVVYGKTDTTPILLSSLANGTGGFILQGAGTNPNQLGWRVAAGGDLNGDGLGDLLVGANTAGEGAGNFPGRAYVVYGTKDKLGTVDISTIGNGAKGLTIEGDATGVNLDQTRIGDDLNYAGDVNGDGRMDFVVAATGGGGGYYVILGKADNNPINLADIKLGKGGFFIDPQRLSPEYTTFSKISVSPAGDVNGDGLADLIVTSPTAPGAYDPSSPSNSAYIVFGKKDTNAVYFKELGKGNGGFKITSATDFSQVTSLGDVNGDGLADFGVVTGQVLMTDPVKTYVIFGKTTNTAIDLNNVAAGMGGYEIKGLGDTPAIVGTFPWLNGIGDINGDGLADMVSGGPKSSDGLQQRYVIFGKADTSAINFSNINGGNAGFAIKAQGSRDFRTEEDWVAPAGDVNGDGFNDLVVSDATSASNTLAADAGRTYIIFGGVGLAKGSTVANSIGSSADEWVVGTRSDDILIGGGGLDRFSGGSGNDTILLTASDVSNLANNTAASLKAFVNGGTGLDTLRLSGGANLDLTKISNIGASGVEENSRIESVERIDMATDAAANTTTIRLNDVIDMSGMNLFNSGTSGLSLVSGTSLGSMVQKHQVMITGNANDAVNMNLASDWSNSGTVVSYNSFNYVVYNANNNVAAQLLIDLAIVNAGQVI